LPFNMVVRNYYSAAPFQNSLFFDATPKSFNL
jgi:hypothetical protein